jgi:hypothetical protein
MASYRYRAQIPAQVIGAEVNGPEADVLIFSKPMPADVDLAQRAKAAGCKIIGDFCDPHFTLPEYKAILELADVVTCSSEGMAEILGVMGHEAVVIPEPYENPEIPPHAVGERLVWFGHHLNLNGILNWRQFVDVRIVSTPNRFCEVIPWSVENVRKELSEANIALFPATKPYKSNNRLVEALRMGCWAFCAQENEFSEFVYTGHPKMGLEVARVFASELNDRVAQAQARIREKYSPERIGELWRQVL